MKPSFSRHIALVITDRETNAQIKKWDVGLLELRADLFKKLDPGYLNAQIRNRKRLKIPLLLTVRNQKKEGGRKAFSDDLKWRLIEAALPLVDIVDIELSSPLLRQVISSARRLRKKVIVSSHYLDATPKDLASILKKSLSARADMVKIAAWAKNVEDVIRMLVFTRQWRRHHLITVSMGPIGAISRLINPMAGSRYAYTFLHKSKAPGQIDVKTLSQLFKLFNYQKAGF